MDENYDWYLCISSLTGNYTCSKFADKAAALAVREFHNQQTSTIVPITKLAPEASHSALLGRQLKSQPDIVQSDKFIHKV